MAAAVAEVAISDPPIAADVFTYILVTRVPAVPDFLTRVLTIIISPTATVFAGIKTDEVNVLVVVPVTPVPSATVCLFIVAPLVAIVKLGYVPDVDIPTPPVKETVWSGAELVTIGTVVVPPIDIPVPADKEVTLLLNVLQSVELNLPVFTEDAIGTLKVCVVPAELIAKSVPLVPVAKV